MRIDVPLTEALTAELFDFWTGVFGGPGDATREMLLGCELEHNRDTLFMERRGDRVAGTCLLTTSRKVPILGGFGEVATAPEYRGSGIATDLCGRAVEDFRSGGGEALFLGTGMSDAARIYYRLGWRKLSGANVMANTTGGDSPEAFLVGYWRAGGQATIGATTPGDRIPMIPLIVSPHDWQVLDANAGIFSTRYRVQGSCMGLYAKYRALTADGRGAWFCARTGDGRVVGMSTARLDGSDGCWVDGFAHKKQVGSWEELIQAAMRWGESAGASSFRAALSVEDEEKRALFESLGFRSAGPGDGFDLDGRTVEGVRLERSQAADR